MGDTSQNFMLRNAGFRITLVWRQVLDLTSIFITFLGKTLDRWLEEKGVYCVLQFEDTVHHGMENRVTGASGTQSIEFKVRSKWRCRLMLSSFFKEIHFYWFFKFYVYVCVRESECCMSTGAHKGQKRVAIKGRCELSDMGVETQASGLFKFSMYILMKNISPILIFLF